jgi:hypothetical protein
MERGAAEFRAWLAHSDAAAEYLVSHGGDSMTPTEDAEYERLLKLAQEAADVYVDVREGKVRGE